MCHPFFDELRDPNTRLPDSRHPGGAARDLPNLFDFSRHGLLSLEAQIHSSRWLIRWSLFCRTFYCTCIEQPAGSPSCTRRSRGPGARHWQLHSSHEGGDDGTSRLSRYVSRYESNAPSIVLISAQLREDMMSCDAFCFVNWDVLGPEVAFMELVDQSRWLDTRELASFLNVWGYKANPHI